MNDSQTTDTILRGAWLHVARAGWITLVLLSMVLWGLGTAALVGDPVPDCLDVSCDPVDFNAGDLEVARELGLPAGFLGRVFNGLAAGTFGVLFFIVGGVIFWRRSDDWMGLFVSFTLVFLGALLFTSSDDALSRTYPELDLTAEVLGALGFACLAGLFYLFPDGRFVPRWTRIPAVALPVLLVATVFAPLFDIIWPVPFLAVLASGVYAQVYRYRRVSSPAQRQQTKWVVIGLLGSVLLMVVWLFVALVYPPEEPISSRVYVLLVVLPVILLMGFLLPLSFAVAILRYRLWDIDVVINRALVYGGLTAALVGTYFGVVVGLQAAFRAATGQESAVAVVASTLVIAALFLPLRRRIQDFIDRRFYRRRYDAARTLAAFSAAVRDEVDLERLSGALVSVVEETMQPAHVSLWLRDPGTRPQRSGG